MESNKVYNSLLMVRNSQRSYKFPQVLLLSELHSMIMIAGVRLVLEILQKFMIMITNYTTFHNLSHRTPKLGIWEHNHEFTSKGIKIVWPTTIDTHSTLFLLKIHQTFQLLLLYPQNSRLFDFIHPIFKSSCNFPFSLRSLIGNLDKS